MRLLLTNDDGIDAPGLAALAASLPDGVEPLIVAPDRQRSECSHSVTTRDRLRIEQRGENRWAVSGTPVDCVRVALKVIDDRVAGVLSGVNDGGNVGADIYMSGTVAAAREAALHGLPAVAISHYRRPEIERRWDHVPRWLDGLLLSLLSERYETGHLWNVNLPAIEPSRLPAVVEALIDQQTMPISFNREADELIYCVDYHNRPRHDGTDVAVCFAGNISITKLPVRY